MFNDYDSCFLAFNMMTYSIPKGVYGTTRKHAFIFILTWIFILLGKAFIQGGLNSDENWLKFPLESLNFSRMELIFGML